MQFYASLFPNAKIEKLERFGAGEQGKEGTVKSGALSIAGQTILFLDSPVSHAFDLTPAISFYVECESAAAPPKCAASPQRSAKAAKISCPSTITASANSSPGSATASASPGS
jgi:hypothetical protein